jgi:carboxylesterase type B
MTRKVPAGVSSVEVKGLGTLRGVSYTDGVRQFYGIPYARLRKRWTLSTLATSWDNGSHDGTKLGYVDVLQHMTMTDLSQQALPHTASA